MGTYGTWEFYETFGGWPEAGETYPDDPDAARDAAREDALTEVEHEGPRLVDETDRDAP